MSHSLHLVSQHAVEFEFDFGQQKSRCFLRQLCYLILIESVELHEI